MIYQSWYVQIGANRHEMKRNTVDEHYESHGSEATGGAKHDENRSRPGLGIHDLGNCYCS